jgi:hypothetical protein
MLSLGRPASGRSATIRVAVIAADPTAFRRFAERASRSETRPDLAAARAVSGTVAIRTAPSTTVTTATTRDQVLVAAVVATRKPPIVTRTTAPIAAPTTQPPAPPITQPSSTTTQPPNVQYGVASWLDTIPAGTCANNVAPMGAILIVTDTDTGASVTCQVVSRGPYVSGRVVDLEEETFARLAPPSQGLINVRVTW